MNADTPQTESPLELSRQIANMVRFGVVKELRLTHPPRCRVQTGRITTDWIQWLSLRAGGTQGRTWWPPRVGEQCLLISPAGALEQAVALVGLFSDALPAASEDPDTSHTQWAEGDTMVADGKGTLTVTLATRIVLQVGGASVVIEADAITASVAGSTLRLDGSGIHQSHGAGSANVTDDGLDAQPKVSTPLVQAGTITAQASLSVGGVEMSQHTHQRSGGYGVGGPPVGS